CVMRFGAAPRILSVGRPAIYLAIRVPVRQPRATRSTLVAHTKRSAQQPPVFPADDAVALARCASQLLPIDDGDASPCIPARPGVLQYAGGGGHGSAAHTEHLRERLLS